MGLAKMIQNDEYKSEVDKFIGEIKNRVDIVDYASRFYSLKKSGDNYGINPCPFHGGDGGNFWIDSKDQLFHCFTCNVGGDVVRFRSMLDQTGQMEAAKKINAEMALGLIPPGGNGDGKITPTVIPFPVPPRPVIRKEKDANMKRADAIGFRNFVIRHYQYNFTFNKAAQNYLCEHRLHNYGKLIDAEIGLSLGNLITSAEKAGITKKDLLFIGVIREYDGKFIEVCRPGDIIYPQRVNGEPAYFRRKGRIQLKGDTWDPIPKDRRNDYQVKLKYAHPGFICYGQQALEEKEFLLVEGEDDRLSVMWKGGYTNVACLKYFPDEHAEKFKGKKVYLCYDNDTAKGRHQTKAGEQFTARMADKCDAAGAEVWIIPLPENSDIDEVLCNAVRNKENPEQVFRSLKDKAVCYSKARGPDPAPSAPDGKGEDKSGPADNPPPEKPDFSKGNPLDFFADEFRVMGEMPDGKILFWCLKKECLYILAEKEVNIYKLIQLGDWKVRKWVRDRMPSKEEKKEWEEKGIESDGKIMFTTLKKAIILHANRNRFSSAVWLGQGINVLEDDPRLAIVNGGKCWFFHQGKLEENPSPVINNKYIIKIEKGNEWADIPLLRLLLAQLPGNKEKFYSDLLREVNQWGFRYSKDSQVITGFVLAMVIQKCWDWGVHLWLTGQGGSGKSMLNAMLIKILGPIAKRNDGSIVTVPGFRQSVNNSVPMVFVDEFEKMRNRRAEIRQGMMDIMRSATRGGEAPMGGKDGQEIINAVKFMAFCSSIEKSVDTAEDIDRYLPPETVKDTTRNPVFPNAEDCKRIGHQVFALALWAKDTAMKYVSSLQGKMTRFEQSLGVAFSIPVIAMGGNENDLKDEISSYVEDITCKDENFFKVNENDLLECILSSRISVTVAQAIEYKDDKLTRVELPVGYVLMKWREFELYGENTMAGIESNGIKRGFTKENADVVTFHPENIQKILLKGTQWEGMKIKGMLTRLEGSEAKKARIGGGSLNCVIIPVETLIKVGLWEEDRTCA